MITDFFFRKRGCYLRNFFVMSRRHIDISELDREHLLEALRSWECGPSMVEELSFKLEDEANAAVIELILPRLDVCLLYSCKVAVVVYALLQLGDTFNILVERPFDTASSSKFMRSFDDLICALRRELSASVELLQPKRRPEKNRRRELVKAFTRLYISLRRLRSVFRICAKEVKEFFTHPLGASKWDILDRSARFA